MQESIAFIEATPVWVKLFWWGLVVVLTAIVIILSIKDYNNEKGNENKLNTNNLNNTKSYVH